MRVSFCKVFDVTLGIRRGSSVISQRVGRRLWILLSYAHGFLVTSNTAELYYSWTDFYALNSELSIGLGDPKLAIDWSLKDQQAPIFRNAEQFG